MKIFGRADLAGRIDHTFLKANGPACSIDQLCAEAKEFGFAMVAINPAEVSRCVDLLKGFPTRVGAAVGFPLGQNTVATKLFEVSNSIDLGAGEIDMVINQRALQAKNLGLIRDEIFGLTELCRKSAVISKVIFECCNIADDEKIELCRIASEAKCNFVKTSTGFGAHGATVHDVALMRKHVSAEVEVKAAGGIRNLATALQMLAAGATRLGTSAGVTIVKEFEDTSSEAERAANDTEPEY